MSRRTRINIVWLTLAALLIATGINVAVHEGWAVAALLACIGVGGMCAPMLTWGGAAKAMTRSDPKAVAAALDPAVRVELDRLDELVRRKELTR